jgi:hypothetical protein
VKPPADRRDRALDRCRYAFDLDQRVHARIALESDRGSVELVLPDVAVDRFGNVIAESHE